MAIKTELEDKLRSKENVMEELRSENVKYKINCSSIKRMLSIERLNLNEQAEELKTLRTEVGKWKQLHDKLCETLKDQESHSKNHSKKQVTALNEKVNFLTSKIDEMNAEIGRLQKEKCDLLLRLGKIFLFKKAHTCYDDLKTACLY